MYVLCEPCTTEVLEKQQSTSKNCTLLHLKRKPRHNCRSVLYYSHSGIFRVDGKLSAVLPLSQLRCKKVACMTLSQAVNSTHMMHASLVRCTWLRGRTAKGILSTRNRPP